MHTHMPPNINKLFAETDRALLAVSGVAPRNLLILEDPAAVTLEEDNLSTVTHIP